MTKFLLMITDSKHIFVAIMTRIVWRCDDMSLPSTVFAVLGLILGLVYPSIMVAYGYGAFIGGVFIKNMVLWGACMAPTFIEPGESSEYVFKQVLGVAFFNVSGAALGSIGAFVFA